MTKKIKSLIKYILYYVINLCVFPSKKIAKNSILLIRLNAIGDYVLFRNFIEILKRSDKYEDFHITLLANCVWQDLALELDQDEATSTEPTIESGVQASLLLEIDNTILYREDTASTSIDNNNY